VDLEIYWARTGTVLTRSPDIRAQQEAEGEGTYWFLGLVLSFNITNINCWNLILKGNNVYNIYTRV